MTARLALSLVKFRAQLDARFPGRSRASDGWNGDAAHYARARAADPAAPWTVSQHVPNAAGIVCGLDVTEDLAAGLDCGRLLDELDASDDGRLFYAIHDGLIENSDDTRTPYTGANRHAGHLHLSVRFDRPSLYDNERPWLLPMLSPIPTIPPAVRIPTMRDEMYLTKDADDDAGAVYLWTSRGPIRLRSGEEVKVCQILLTTAPGDVGRQSGRFHRLAAAILARPVSVTV